MNNKKALIAMSGGVDSSVAAFLMKLKGYECVGATMKLFDNEDVGISGKKTCCSLKDIDDARSVAGILDITHHVFNFTIDFKEQVIQRFINAYEYGETPNPCIDCNRFMKFDKLLKRALVLDMNVLVTGHYARIVYDDKTKRFLLKKAIDKTKDQSYFLYNLTQKQLAHTMFPLGELQKTEIREIALKQNFKNAKKNDSQDICFVRDGDYVKFIEQYTNKSFESGYFTDKSGKILGKNKGIIRYTVGQRKGLGLSFPHPMYVYSINSEDNSVVLCEEDGLFAESLIASDFNFLAIESIEKPMKLKAKIRYKQEEQWAVVKQISKDSVQVDFEQPQRAIAKGQAVVLYDDDVVIGGGTIKKCL